MSSPSPQSPRRWLLKNTDSFAGFAHAINTFISGVSLAHRFGFGLLHRPQPMAHSLGYTFDSFFALDRRGVAVAPVFAPTLEIANKSMLIDGRVVALKVITAAAADNASLLGDWLSDTPPDTIVWLRKGRAAMPADCPACGLNTEVRYAALWFRERFWRAAFARLAQFALEGRPDRALGANPSVKRMREAAAQLGPRRVRVGSSRERRGRGGSTMSSASSDVLQDTLEQRVGAIHVAGAQQLSHRLEDRSHPTASPFSRRNSELIRGVCLPICHSARAARRRLLPRA